MRFPGRKLNTMSGMSSVGEPSRRIIYENTYIVGPDGHGPGSKFEPDRLQREVENLLQATCQSASYSPPEQSKLAQELVAAVRDMCVALGHSRYKYAVHVTYGQRANQGSLLSSKCLWDGQTDGYVTATIVNETLFCSCQVFAFYFE
ncbi:DLT2 [Auxenochlorella protothecoides x Auxenochlorella symbiontica]